MKKNFIFLICLLLTLNYTFAKENFTAITDSNNNIPNVKTDEQESLNNTYNKQPINTQSNQKQDKKMQEKI